MRKFFLVTMLAVALANVQAADQADLWMQEGLKILKEKPDDVVRAAALFAKASEAFEANKDDAKATEANSCLYWTRKKFTARDLNVISTGNPTAAKQMEIVIAPRKDNPKDLLAKVDEYAKTSKDSLLVAIRYFEIADRFPTTEEGRKAMDASLKSMTKVSVKEVAVKNEVPEKIDSKFIVGIWDGEHPKWKSRVEFLEDGSFRQLDASQLAGHWSFDGTSLTMEWDKYPASVLKMINNNSFYLKDRGDFNLKRRKK